MGKKQPQRGGTREGAGRKIENAEEGRTIPITASVPENLVKLLDQWSSIHGVDTRSKATAQAIRVLTAELREGKTFLKMTLSLEDTEVHKAVQLPENWEKLSTKQQNETIEAAKEAFLRESVEIRHSVETPQ